MLRDEKQAAQGQRLKKLFKDLQVQNRDLGMKYADLL